MGDEKDDRRSIAWINYALILGNLFVFVFLQGLGSNDKFTYAYSTVPLEIVTGRDVVTPDRIVIEPISGQRVAMTGISVRCHPAYSTQLPYLGAQTLVRISL